MAVRQPAVILVLVVGAILVGAMVASLKPKKVIYVERRPRPAAPTPGPDEQTPGGQGSSGGGEYAARQAPQEPPLLSSPPQPSALHSLPQAQGFSKPPGVEGTMAGGLTALEWGTLREHSWHVAVILPHLPALRTTADKIDAFHQWRLTQLVPDELDIMIRLYLFVESERMWEVEDHIRENQLEGVHVRTCAGVTESSIDTLTQYNCIARNAVEEGAHFVASVDVVELTSVIDGDGPVPGGSTWLLKAVAALLKTDCDENIYVPEVRHLGVAGRGAQWRSELSLEHQYVWEHFRKEIIEAQKNGNDVPVLYQYKPLNQFSGSFVVHAQHVRAMKGVFEPSIANLSDGLQWLTGLYSYYDTYRVDDWPAAYGDYNTFMNATNARFWPDAWLSGLIAASTLDLYEAKVKILLDKYNIVGCEVFEELVASANEFIPENTAHSSKNGISLGTFNGEKLFIFALGQGGPHLRRRATLKNLHSMLMLHQSPWTATLFAYCDQDRMTAVKFIEGRGDYKTGTMDTSCGFRVQASLDLVHTLQEIHKLGMIQCDWKLGQWIFNEEDRLLMVDVDSLENVPSDCGQAEVHRHPATVNFGQVNEASRGWDDATTMQVLLDQFLMEDKETAYPRYDLRYDTYKLGGSIYFHDVLDYRGACQPFIDEAKAIISNVREIYPPSLEEVERQLQELADLVEDHERLELIRQGLIG